ncbi:MAG: inositol-3-phosphate synthase [Planctomycetes bacterium]|nr:inositol-3-phosphate synthase [Planctomycetota bacterium]
MPSKPLGVWLIGAGGGVATTVLVGVEALKAGLTAHSGLVTDLEPFHGLDLAGLDDLVFGGHEVRQIDCLRAAKELRNAAGFLSSEMLAAAQPALEATSSRLRPGILCGSSGIVEGFADLPGVSRGPSLRAMSDRVVSDLRAFQSSTDARTVVVVNLASTEPAGPFPPEAATREGFERLLDADRRPDVTASMLYAYAAISCGFPFVNFTPAWGAAVPGIDQLARERGVPHCGRDGKTGETLVKSVLAPLFLARNLKVLAWTGHNLLGNRDGQVLEDPSAKAAKVADKDAVLRSILRDDDAHTHVRIDYVPSLDDWKTAWDFIQFQGFLDTRMSLQFIWQGCDSVLAAPLVLDLVRLANLAQRRGEAGPMLHAACFFKHPIGVEEHDFSRQFAQLSRYAEQARRSHEDTKARRDTRKPLGA